MQVRIEENEPQAIFLAGVMRLGNNGQGQLDNGNTEKHHLIPNSRGGNGFAHNLLELPASAHKHWHILYGNKTHPEILFLHAQIELASIESEIAELQSKLVGLDRKNKGANSIINKIKTLKKRKRLLGAIVSGYHKITKNMDRTARRKRRWEKLGEINGDK